MLQKKNDTVSIPVRDEGTVSSPESGLIDESLIEHTLSLSFEERIEAHEAARQLVKDLQKAGNEHYARQSKGPS